MDGDRRELETEGLVRCASMSMMRSSAPWAPSTRAKHAEAKLEGVHTPSVDSAVRARARLLARATGFAILLRPGAAVSLLAYGTTRRRKPAQPAGHDNEELVWGGQLKRSVETATQSVSLFTPAAVLLFMAYFVCYLTAFNVARAPGP